MPLIIGTFTVVLLGLLVYASFRGVAHPPAPVSPYDDLLRGDTGEHAHPLRILLAIDGSPGSVAAVNDVANGQQPAGSAVQILIARHSRVPMISDPAFAFAAAREDDLHEQARRIPEILHAAVTRLSQHRPLLDVTTKVVDGEPADVILREASEWRAERVVLGSHGHGPIRRAMLGSTAAALAAAAPCSVLIARAAPRQNPAQH